MKVTYNWLKDFVDIKLPPQELADKLTMAGIEVSAIEEKHGDFVFDIEITSNRPDWLSVIGLAREVAAITGGKLKTGLRGKGQGLSRDLSLNPYRLTLNIEDEKDCPLYTAKIITGIKIGPSPEWMSKRLELVGLRSVNNIVDITNYCLFETGEPLHAFDLDKLSPGSITVRRARQGESITTIDDKLRILSSQALVIADDTKVVAVAGVMGGKNSEVTYSTKNILLEAAVFNPVIIRRSRQFLSLNSESSYRFERGVPAEVAQQASARAAELIIELAGGRLVLTKQQGVAKTKAKNIVLNLKSVDKLLGVNFKPTQIRQGLCALGFKVKTKSKNIFNVGVPEFRQDILIPEDLIEEIARVCGYQKVPITLPAIKPRVASYTAREEIAGIKNLLVNLGMNEVITYSLVDKSLLADFCSLEEGKIIEILNPMSEGQDVLRPTLIPSLATRVAFNLNRKQDYINIFEIADIYFWQKGNNEPKEEPALAIAFCGSRSLFSEHGSTRDNAGFLHVKGVLNALFENLKITGCRFLARQDNSPEIEVFINNDKVGRVMILSKGLLDKLDIKNRQVCLAEVSLERIFPLLRHKKIFKELPGYPSINRDISIVLKQDVSLEEVLEAVKQQAGLLLESIRVADFYKGKQIPSGFIGVTISCIFRSPERTLLESEVAPLHAQIIEFLAKKYEAKLR